MMFQSILSVNNELFFQAFGLAGHNPILDFLMVFGADYLIFIIFLFLAYVLFFKEINEKKSILLILLSFGVGFILLETVGRLIYEPRPFMTYPITPLISHAPDDSFPSDHTFIVTIIAASFAYYRSKFAPLLTLAVLWVGISRIYVGVHYPLDIVGGIIFGIVTVWIAVRVKKVLLRKFNS